MIKNTCKDCKCRRLGCHAICSEYKKFKEQMDQIHKAKESENKIKNDIVEGYKKYYKSNKNRLHTCKYSNG
jgi:hypothetical protein